MQLALRLRLIPNRSCQDPLAPSLDVFIQHDANVRQDKSTHNEAKELRCVSGAQFEPHMGWRGMLQSWIFHLADDLICGLSVSNAIDSKVMVVSVAYLEPVQHRKVSPAHPCSLDLVPRIESG